MNLPILRVLPSKQIRKRLQVALLAVASVLFVASVAPFVRAQKQPESGPPLKAATIQVRRYVENIDGTVTEKGTKTVYLSVDGSYTIITRDEKGKRTQTLIADAEQNAAFLVNGMEATKMFSSVGSKTAGTPEDYQRDPAYVGETVAFGEVAYIQRSSQENSGQTDEVTSIPALKFPVKFVTIKNADGSKKVDEAISILWGEPPKKLLRLPEGATVTDGSKMLDEQIKQIQQRARRNN